LRAVKNPFGNYVGFALETKIPRRNRGDFRLHRAGMNTP
jgi:hypothetical protein